jgi:hypothetical protein
MATIYAIRSKTKRQRTVESEYTPGGVTPHQRILELRYGRPIREIICDAINRTGQQRLAAAELGVSEFALISWMRRLGVRARLIAEPVEAPERG